MQETSSSVQVRQKIKEKNSVYELLNLFPTPKYEIFILLIYTRQKDIWWNRFH